MPLSEARSRVWYVRQQRIAQAAIDRASRAWALLDRADLTTSWNGGLGPYLTRVLSTAQVTAAAGATAYTSAVVTDVGRRPSPAGVVNPAAFGGYGADGRSLADLLYLAVIDVKEAISLGIDIDLAMNGGLGKLLTYIDTEVADASRAAVQVAGTADSQVIGYVRYLSPPSCSRCIVLAGKFFKHNEGFARHPKCDCQHRPITRAEWDEHRTDISSSPRTYVEQSTDAQLADSGFSQAEVKALREGADMSRVVNAHRGLYVAGEQRGARGGRPTVAAIYRQAGEDRQEAVDLLRRAGYLQ